ncbi:hypothetical protein CBR_g89062, partial [Chara braunii]
MTRIKEKKKHRRRHDSRGNDARMEDSEEDSSRSLIGLVDDVDGKEVDDVNDSVKERDGRTIPTCTSMTSGEEEVLEELTDMAADLIPGEDDEEDGGEEKKKGGVEVGKEGGGGRKTGGEGGEENGRGRGRGKKMGGEKGVEKGERKPEVVGTREEAGHAEDMAMAAGGKSSGDEALAMAAEVNAEELEEGEIEPGGTFEEEEGDDRHRRTAGKRQSPAVADDDVARTEEGFGTKRSRQ